MKCINRSRKAKYLHKEHKANRNEAEVKIHEMTEDEVENE